MRLLVVVVLLGYPVTAHLGIQFNQPEVAAYYLAFLLSLPLLTTPVHRNRRTFVVGLIFLPLVIILLVTRSGSTVVLYQPAVLYFAIAMVFARTLAADSEPLVTRFIRAMNVKIPQAVDAYGRQTTRRWAGFFGALALISLVLATYSPIKVWSWFVNVATYVLVALMLTLDYIRGRRWFAEHEAIGFLEFVRGLTRVKAQGIGKR